MILIHLLMKLIPLYLAYIITVNMLLVEERFIGYRNTIIKFSDSSKLFNNLTGSLPDETISQG